MRKYQLLGHCPSEVKGDDLPWVLVVVEGKHSLGVDPGLIHHVAEDLLGELGGLGVAGVSVLALVTNISTTF